MTKALSFKKILGLMLVITMAASVMVFNTVSAAIVITNLSVKDSANSADWSIQSNLQVGNLQYGDRTFSLTAVPTSVAGNEWIRTANDSKAYTTDPLVTFTVTSNVDVYVAHNDSIGTKPSWMSGWTDTGENIVNNESTPRTFSLFKKSFTANSTVSLGNNGSTSSGMYIVIVKPAGSTSTPAPTLTPTPTSASTPTPTSTATPTPLPAGNLALNKTYLASSEWNATYSAAKACDGTTSTRWASASGTSAGSWLRVDFGSNTTYTQVVIKETNYANITSFKLQSSNDGSAFTDIASGTTIGASKTITFSSVTSRYLRLYVVSALDEANVNEMEVYNPTPGEILPPQNLLSPSYAKTDTSALLIWDKPSNIYSMSDFSSYCVFRNGVQIAETTKLGYTATGLTANSSYSFTVRTKNLSGTLSSDSNTLSVTTKSTGPVYNITSYGAVGDGQTINTQAIQNAINACSSGGTVLIPSGTFVSGALFLKSNMTLKIASGGVLKGSSNPSDYLPLIPCRFEGFELDCYASLLTLGSRDNDGPYNISNVTICGEGTIDGNGYDLGNSEKTASGNRSRGRTICMMDAQNVYVQGLTVSYGPAWTVHAIYCDSLTFDGLSLVSKNATYRIANGDGIDPDSSTNVNIFNCYFKTGDDSIAIKSGKNNEGYTIGRSTEYIRVTDCVIDGSNGGIVIGSEMSGSVRHVLVQNCSINNLSWEGLDIKSNVVRGGIVEDVTYKDITMSNNRLAIRLTMNYSVNNDGTPAPVPPIIRNINYQNVNCTSGATTAIQIDGLSNSILNNVYLKDCAITSTNGVTVNYADTVTFDNVVINNSTGQAYTITNSTNIVNK
jgi:exo-poly-alpha-galacturonosidase